MYAMLASLCVSAVGLQGEYAQTAEKFRRPGGVSQTQPDGPSRLRHGKARLLARHTSRALRGPKGGP